VFVLVFFILYGSRRLETNHKAAGLLLQGSCIWLNEFAIWFQKTSDSLSQSDKWALCCRKLPFNRQFR